MGITDVAIDKLRGLIMSGELAPGARLPPEQELAAQLGISRGSAREAVRALAHAKMLSVRRGDGTYVTSLEPHQLLHAIGFAAELARNESVLDVVEVRRLLEPGATALAATRISPGELEDLKGHLEAMRATADDAEAFIRHDAAFHNCVAQATGNQWLVEILRGLGEPTARARRMRVVDDRGVSDLTISQHEEIYQALLEGDAALAQAAALSHVCSTQRGVRSVLLLEGADAALREQSAAADV
jgi:GntR family transcriptional repressor for pyruvate dehydrogenase complex